MDHLSLFESEPGAFSLTMDAGRLPVDPVVEELGHEPNGYFWEGVAQWLVDTELRDLQEGLEFDSEGGMFCVYGSDRAALEKVGEAMAAVVSDPGRLRAIVSAADDAGFAFDD